MSKTTYLATTNSLINNGRKKYYARVFEKTGIYTLLVWLGPEQLDQHIAQRDAEEWVRKKQRKKK